MRTSAVALLLLIVVALALALAHCGSVETFAVVAEAPGEEPASPVAVAISRLLFGGMTVALCTLLGWFCLRWLRR